MQFFNPLSNFNFSEIFLQKIKKLGVKNPQFGEKNRSKLKLGAPVMPLVEDVQMSIEKWQFSTHDFSNYDAAVTNDRRD